MTTSFVFLMPLTFASNIFVGLETMPAWLQAVVRHNPVTHLTNASRGLMHGTAGRPPTSSGCWWPPPPSSWSPRRSPCACTTRNGRSGPTSLLTARAAGDPSGVGVRQHLRPASLIVRARLLAPDETLKLLVVRRDRALALARGQRGLLHRGRLGGLDRRGRHGQRRRGRCGCHLSRHGRRRRRRQRLAPAPQRQHEPRTKHEDGAGQDRTIPQSRIVRARTRVPGGVAAGSVPGGRVPARSAVR